MDSDTRHPRFFGSPVHLPMEIALGDSKHPVIWPDSVEHFEIVLNFIRQKLRHGDDAVAFLCLWGGNQVLAVQPLIGFIDGYSAFLKIEISGRERQQLSFPDSAPVEHFKSVEGLRLVHHRLGKFQILFLGPEHHLSVFLLAHAACLLAGILPEVVVPHRMVKNGTELVVDGFEIHRRVGLAVFVLVVQHLVLPGDDLLGGDVAHFELTEVGQQLGADDVILGGPGVFLEPGFHVCRIEVHEALEGHIQIGGGFVELFPFPCLRLPLGLETPLLGLFALAVPVGIAVDRSSGVGLFFLIDCHQLPLLSFSP